MWGSGFGHMDSVSVSVSSPWQWSRATVKNLVTRACTLQRWPLLCPVLWRPRKPVQFHSPRVWPLTWERLEFMWMWACWNDLWVTLTFNRCVYGDDEADEGAGPTHKATLLLSSPGSNSKGQECSRWNTHTHTCMCSLGHGSRWRGWC